ncbi:CHAT domain-containing protein [Actinospica durhamensis]|uniref:CHAT domain-containing protein n=1 Tax=Actinospica durhamensis TaxID=1508375 RepID=A0A941ISM9_9ACTN|nr:CHAT domain-containing protein [Actinospica durhamensis]MBR7838694.1 CHAT domain-containing protein [Actinospica durhamensis]
MTPGVASLDPRRVAEVVVQVDGGRTRRGSGYLVTAKTVLTAAHVVAGAVAVSLRFNADRSAECTASGLVTWSSDAVDAAVVEIVDVAGGRVPFEPGHAVAFGRLPDQDTSFTFSALGFPLFKLRGDRSAPTLYRDSHHEVGTVNPWSNMREGTLALTVHSPADSSPDRSPWEGMSGAAVWVDGRLVGLVSEHHRSDGPGMLAASRIDRWFEHPRLTRGEISELSAAIGLPLDALDLVEVRAPASAALPGLVFDLVSQARRRVVLPPDPAGFVGRETEVEVLLDLLRPDDVGHGGADPVLVSAVAGLGGIGKSTLAVRACHRAFERGWFAGGVYFLDMRGFEQGAGGLVTASQAIATMLRSLVGAVEPIPEAAEEQLILYRALMATLSTHRSAVLLVLDNVFGEHQVEPLVPGIGSHRVLITSRNSLAALRARLIEVDGLTPAAGRALIERALAAAHPEDARCADEPDELTALVELCEYLPLALEIVAARLKSTPRRTLRSMVEELQDARTRLDSLMYEGDPPRGVESAFGASYRHLPPATARLFRLLAIGPGPDTDLATAAVLSAQTAAETRRQLEALERAHLTRADATGERWSMHDLVRLYARKLADQDDKDANDEAIIRAIAHYLDGAERAAVGPTQQDTGSRGSGHEFERGASAWLTERRPNLVASAGVALELGYPELTLRLGRVLAPYLRAHQFHEDRLLLATALERAGHITGAAQTEMSAALEVGDALESLGRLADALDAYEHVASLADAAGDPRGVARALLSAGETRRRLGDLAEAGAAWRRVVDIAEKHGLIDNLRAALAQFAAALEASGLSLATQVELSSSGAGQATDRPLDAARARLARAIQAQEAGHQTKALAGFAAVLPVLREHGDTESETKLLNARGTLFARRGESVAAERDLRAASSLARAGRFTDLYLASIHGLGVAALRAGDLARALRHLDQALWLDETSGPRMAPILLDRAETLLAAGLATEARENAQRAVELYASVGLTVNAAEARLLVARAALTTSELSAARENARAARLVFAQQRRPAWAAWARFVEHSARFSEGERTAALLRDLHRNVDYLEDVGPGLLPQESMLVAARVAISLGRRATAESLLTDVARIRVGGTARGRVLGWEAETALRELRGDTAGAGRAVTQGLHVVAAFAGTLGATDMRVGVSSLGAELAETGLRLAVESGSARRILVRAEQWRATVLRQRPVHAPADSPLAERLARLRALVATISEEGPAGRDVRRLQIERVRLEEEIRELARHAPGVFTPELPLDVAMLAAHLGERALVEYIRLGDQLHAVTLVAGRTRLYRLGSYAEVLAELDGHRFALVRLARQHGSAALLRGAQDVFQYTRGRMDRLLLEPMTEQLRGRQLVIVPTGSLHALAWATLPSLSGTPLVIAPSARSWMAAASRPAGPDPAAGGVFLAHGPGLMHAGTEIHRISRKYPDARVLSGEGATVEAVLEGLDGASIAHLSTHGRFRADNPLFSSLEFADGPLTVYDLEGLARGPRTVILSCSDAALSGIRPGDELMGMASALLAAGTRSLIASVGPVGPVGPVGDEELVEAMDVFHAALAAGRAPAEALLAMQDAVPQACTFVCYGA